MHAGIGKKQTQSGLPWSGLCGDWYEVGVGGEERVGWFSLVDEQVVGWLERQQHTTQPHLAFLSLAPTTDTMAQADKGCSPTVHGAASGLDGWPQHVSVARHSSGTTLILTNHTHTTHCTITNNYSLTCRSPLALPPPFDTLGIQAVSPTAALHSSPNPNGSATFTLLVSGANVGTAPNELGRLARLHLPADDEGGVVTFSPIATAAGPPFTSLSLSPDGAFHAASSPLVVSFSLPGLEARSAWANGTAEGVPAAVLLDNQLFVDGASDGAYNVYSCNAGSVGVIAANLSASRWDGVSDGLPSGPCSSVAATQSSLIVGTSGKGGMRRGPDGSWSYYYGPRWLPGPADPDAPGAGDVVASLALSAPGDDNERFAFVTKVGISVIGSRRWTLAQKASFYETVVMPRHHRLLGYVTRCEVASFGAVDECTPRGTDNDGLYTAVYVAAQAYRTAAGGEDAEAGRAAGMRAFAALEFLANVSEPYNTRTGFVARSVANGTAPPVDNRGEWVKSVAAPGFFLKANTSSDEVTGHMLAYHLTHRFLAATDSERSRASRLVANLAGGIVSHNYTLLDYNNTQRTAWGVWTPAVLNGVPGMSDQRGTNSLQLLAWLAAAADITGNDTFIDHFGTLVRDHQYDVNMINAKLENPEEYVYFDDELSFFPFLNYAMTSYTPYVDTFPTALAHAFQQTRRQHEAMWHFVSYNLSDATLGNDPADFASSAETLRHWPISMVNWATVNSHRLDIQRDYRVPNASLYPLRADEADIFRWQDNFFRLDQVRPTSGMQEASPAAWLLAYYYGKYTGVILPE